MTFGRLVDRKSIDDAYVDGISITTAFPNRQHIWTYAVGMGIPGGNLEEFTEVRINFFLPIQCSIFRACVHVMEEINPHPSWEKIIVSSFSCIFFTNFFF
jgi:hypothetical protein